MHECCNREPIENGTEYYVGEYNQHIVSSGFEELLNGRNIAIHIIYRRIADMRISLLGQTLRSCVFLLSLR